MVAVSNHSCTLQVMDDRVPHGQDDASMLSNLDSEDRVSLEKAIFRAFRVRRSKEPFRKASWRTGHPRSDCCFEAPQSPLLILPVPD
jgi:hypothetical protein